MTGAHSYVSCLVHRGRVPREDAVAIDPPAKGRPKYKRQVEARRRHICVHCICRLGAGLPKGVLALYMVAEAAREARTGVSGQMPLIPEMIVKEDAA